MIWKHSEPFISTLALVASLGLAVAGSGCAPPSGSPHLLVITVDTLRADHVSGYGYGRATTPAMDRLMTEGVAFLAASTPTPTTAPSHASLFTGTYPRTHGVSKNGLTLSSDRPTLAEVLRARGYRTSAVVSAFPLASRFGLARGFEHFDDRFPIEEASIDTREWEGMTLTEAFDRRADATTDRALALLDVVPSGQPVFLWVHYYDAHAPYDPPGRYRDLFSNPPAHPGELGRAIAAYDAEARFVDDNVARMIEAVDARFGAERVVVVVATDHGEGLMDHGWMEHGVHLYEELVRVALIFRWRGSIVAGSRPPVPVSLIDVAPTVLALLGCSPAILAAEGADLSPVLRGTPAPTAPRPLFFERRLYTSRDEERWPTRGSMFAVREGAWKYVEALEEGRHELFDLATDPGETRNRRETDAATGERLAGLLAAWRARQPDVPSEGRVSAEDAARLRALGYIE
jgi:arylsulfatase A-like enzyme